MKFFIFILSIFFSTYSFSQTIVWEKEIGGGEDDWGYSICFSHDQQLVFTGVTLSYDEEVLDSLGGTDIWLAKMSTDSTMLWSKSLGGTQDDRGNAVSLTSDNGFIVTGFSFSNDINVANNHGGKDVVLIKTDEDGNLEWSKLFGGSSDDIGNSVIQSSDGGYMLAGTTFSTNGDISFNHGSSDFWIIKTNEQGDLLWEKTYAGSGEDRANEIIETQDGNFIIIGTSFSTDGDVSNNLGGVDFWIIKINTDGELLWEKNLGGSSADQAYDVIETSSGEILIVGEVLSNDVNVTNNHGQTDAWMTKLSANGDIIWQRALGGTKVDYFLSVTEGEDGHYLATGNTFSSNGNVSTNLGASDIWLIKMAPDGHLVWEVSLGYDLNEIGNDIITNNENIYIIGGIQVDHLSRHGNSDVYIMKLFSPFTSSVIPIHSNMNIKFYPNPAIETIRLESKEKMLEYSIFDVQGKKVMYNTLHSNQFEIPIQNLAKGQYYLYLKSANDKEFSAPIFIAPKF